MESGILTDIVEAHKFSNSEIARMLREVAAAYTIKKGNIFQIRAYDGAADSVEHSSEEIKDLWEEDRLDQIPGVGESIKNHLNELFKTGKVKHWEAVKKGIPEAVFKLLGIPGVGPKTALTLGELGVKDVADLSKKLQSRELVKGGFSEKIALRIQAGISEVPGIKTGRVLLPYAAAQADRVLEYLQKSKEVVRADALGSLRRMVPTVGDLDFAVATKEPEQVISYLANMPGVVRVVDSGERNISVTLTSGLRLDFIVVQPTSYGALLQHFTGSKSHNIHLRTIAEGKGFSLSEYGVKKIKSKEVIHTEAEEELYGLLGMDTPPPEIREDTGEIEAALKHQLPKLIELKDIKGDLHTHSSYPIEPSHDAGADSIEELLKMAQQLGYKYLGIADHSPSLGNHTKDQIIKLIKKRTQKIEQINSSQKTVRVLNLLEVDIMPDGSLSVPDEGLKLLDFALVGVHSLHTQPKSQMTKRILKALENPYVKVLNHPTGRLLNQRNSYDADWEEIFEFAAKHNKALEVNAYPNRLDLTDNMIREAKKLGVKFVINTDSHQAAHMGNVRFGVAMARRGWVTKEDVVNTWEWKKFAEWFNI